MRDEQQNDLAAAGAEPTCPKCDGAMWDNRASKRNPRAPDYKCKSAGCDGVIWPPRDAAAAPAGGAGAAGGAAAPAGPKPAGTPDDPACPVCGGKMWDDRTSKRNPRAPDFKCRNKPKVMGGPGCPGIIWPPRDGEQRRPAPSGGGASGGRGAAAPAARPYAPPSAPPAVEREFNDDEIPDFGPDDDDDLPF